MNQKTKFLALRLYFVNSVERKSSAISYDKKIQKRLWEISLELSGIKDLFI